MEMSRLSHTNENIPLHVVAKGAEVGERARCKDSISSIVKNHV